MLITPLAVLVVVAGLAVLITFTIVTQALALLLFVPLLRHR